MGKTVKIKAVRKLDERQPVFNMEVEETHNFITKNGIILHNCYDSLRYGLINYHQTVSRPVYTDSRTAHKRYKDRLCQQNKRRRAKR